jgi:uncharacterized protein (DUF1015 family)
MVRVVPFRAYLYNKEKIEDYSKVVSPPYDIIKGKKVDNFQSRSTYNIAWIIKNKPTDDDTPENNQYTRARDLLNSWVDDEILIQDQDESFYVYGQNFKIDGEERFRFGFIGLVELEEFASSVRNQDSFSGVLQHEETLPKDIKDRLNLCRNCMAQFGQIFVIYPDHKKEVDSILEKNMKDNPIIDIIDDEGIRHRIWRINDKSDTDGITEAMADKYVIIADGHHRYKTALALQKENPDLETAKYRMLTFVNINNSGLVVLPTHRLVQNLDDFSTQKLIQGVREYFGIDEDKDQKDMFRKMNENFVKGKHSFGLFMDDGKFYTLTLKDIGVINSLLTDKSNELKKLDVTILHSLILDKILGIDKEKLAQGTMSGGGYVVYIKGIGDAVEEAINAVMSEAQAVFFMNPTRVEEVEAVSNNFECMPQKSTFFHPKVWSGFTINKLK